MGDGARRALFITNTRIGDTILTTGALEALHAADPDLRFTVVAGPVAAPLFADTPYVERVIPLRKQPLSAHWFVLWGRLVGTVWDTVVDMRGSGVSRALIARRRFIRTSTRGDRRHKAVQAAAVIGLQDDPPAPRVRVSEATRAALLSRLPPGPLLALSPAANRVGKTWPLDRFIALTDQATAPSGPLEGWTVAVLGGPEDRAAAQALTAALPGRAVLDFTGEALLPTAALLERADLFVGNDSGLMHLAAAAGAPVVALFGPTDERLYGPYAQRRIVVRPPGGPAAYGPTSRTVSETECQMTGIEVSQVLDAVRALLAARPAA